MYDENDMYIPMYKVEDKETGKTMLYGKTSQGIAVMISPEDFFNQCNQIARAINARRNFCKSTIEVATKYTNTDILVHSGFYGLIRCDN